MYIIRGYVNFSEFFLFNSTVIFNKIVGDKQIHIINGVYATRIFLL